MKTEIKDFSTITLAKAIHYTSAAIAQYETLIIERKSYGGEKAFIQMQIKRLRACQNDVFARLKTRESTEILREELSDEYRIDSFVSMLMLLNEDGWNKAEAELKKLIEQ